MFDYAKNSDTLLRIQSILQYFTRILEFLI